MYEQIFSLHPPPPPSPRPIRERLVAPLMLSFFFGSQSEVTLTGHSYMCPDKIFRGKGMKGPRNTPPPLLPFSWPKYKYDDKSFEFAEKIKHLGKTLTDQNCIHEEFKSKLNSGNACFHSVQNPSFPVWYTKI
jgi:hypothetical protein